MYDTAIYSPEANLHSNLYHRTVGPDKAGTAQNPCEGAAKEPMMDDDQWGSPTAVLSKQRVGCLVCCLLFSHQVFCLSGGCQRLNVPKQCWHREDEVEEGKKSRVSM